MNSRQAVCLLVKPAGSLAGEAVHRGLQAAGMRVVAVPTIFDAVAEAVRCGGRLRRLVVSVDGFGREEFRLFPLVRREWPEAEIIAYHSPGFDYKGRLAELVGADMVLESAEDISRFLDGLAPEAAAPPPSEEPAAPAAPAASVVAPPAAARIDARQSARAYLARPAQTPDAASAAPQEPAMAAGPVPAMSAEPNASAEPAAEAPLASPWRMAAAPRVEDPSLAALKAAINEDPVPVDEAGSPVATQAVADPAGQIAAGTETRRANTDETRGAIADETRSADVAEPASASPQATADETLVESDSPGGDVIGTVELTEEELRLLLGEEEDA